MNRVRRVLLVEDDPLDADLLLRALRAQQVEFEFLLARDSSEFEASVANNRIDLVILDINLPGASGLDLLGWFRSMPENRTVPVTVWSSSVNRKDIQEAYLKGANAYCEKPDSLAGYKEFAEGWVKFWMRRVLLS